MEHQLYYSDLVLIRQDSMKIENLYQNEEKLPTEETIEHVKRLVQDHWQKAPEGRLLLKNLKM
jgi:hypothetical protein